MTTMKDYLRDLAIEVRAASADTENDLLLTDERLEELVEDAHTRLAAFFLKFIKEEVL